MFTRLGPARRLLLAAVVAWTLIAAELGIWIGWMSPQTSEKSAVTFLLPPGLAAGTWLALFFLMVPLPSPRPLARAGAVLGGFLAGFAAPLAALVTAAALAQGFATREPWAFLVMMQQTAFVSAALVGLGFGVAGWAVHRALDPRLRRRRVGWLAWLPTSAWAGAVPPLLFLPGVGNLLGDSPVYAFSTILLLATLPHLLMQLTLTRRLSTMGSSYP